jgi:N utilization substance protein A
MELVVPDDQLAKAIGRRGQNVRLAAQLTGWRIDIFSEAKHADMLGAARNEIARVGPLDEQQVEILVRSGFQSAQELADAEAGEVAAILEIEAEAAQVIVQGADEIVGKLIMEEANRRKTVGEAVE